MPYRPSFLIAARHRSLADAESTLRRDKRVMAMQRGRAVLWLKGEPTDVLEVTPYRYTDVKAICDNVRKQLGVLSYHFHNVDIPIPSRWMQERGLFPFCRLHPTRLEAQDDRWSINYPTPELRTWTLRVDADGPRDWTTPLARIHINDTVIEAAGRERDALLELAERIRVEDPDVYFTHGGDPWDIPYLLHRIRANDLAHAVTLGRLPDPVKPSQVERSFQTYGRDVYRPDAYFLRGRLHIDLSRKFLPDSSPRTGLGGIIYLARSSNTDPQRLARNSPGSCIQQVQIDRAREMGVQIPWKRNQSEQRKTLRVMVELDRGGQVHCPEPGLFEDAWSLDYSGYYPALIVRHNLSSETINCACCPDSDHFVPGTKWHVCRRHEGHQVRALRPFVEHRRYCKALRKRRDVAPERLAWAEAITSELKAIGVVCFGYARYRQARFGCAEVHQAIQAFGREGMTRAKELAEEAGFERLHTLTDGMVIRRRGATLEEVKALARRISCEVGVPMEIDANFDWVVFLPSKTMPGVGVPNRYYGRRRDGALKVRGIEVRRHSTGPWLQRAQEAALAELAEARTAVEFHRRIPRSIERCRQYLAELESAPVEDFSTEFTVSQDVEDYHNATHAKIALQKLGRAGIPVHAGQSVGYVVLRGSEAAVEQRVVPTLLARQPGPLGGPARRPDRDHYVRLLARSMETLLAPFGHDEQALMANLEADNPPTQPPLPSGSFPVALR